MVLTFLGLIDPSVKKVVEILLLVPVVNLLHWESLPFALEPGFEIINPANNHPLIVKNF